MNRDPKPHPPTDHPPAASDLHLLQRRIRVARGLEPADLLLTGGQVVNVFTQRVEPAEIVVADGWIAGVGPQLGPAHHTIALAGRAVLAGPDRPAHAPGEHVADLGGAGPVDRASRDDHHDLRLPRGGQRPGRLRP